MIPDTFTTIFPYLITAIILALGWLMKDKFNSLGNRIDKLENKFEKLENKIENIRDAVIELQVVFSQMGYSVKRIVGTTSPQRLTEYGKRLVRESGFDKIFEENREKILGWVKEDKPETRYDAQEISRKILLGRWDDPIFKPLRYYAYERGDVIPQQILFAGSIIVRDAVIGELGLDK